MKKTLAVILAAAMAASMSTVAFAKDFQNNGTYFDNAGSSSGATAVENGWIVLGKSKTYKVEVNSVELRDGFEHSFSTEDLAQMIEDNYLSASVVVTSGKDKLSSMPTVKVVGNEVQLKVGFKDTWGIERHKDDGGDPNVSAKLYVKFTAKKSFSLDEEKESKTIVTWKDGGDTYYLTNDGYKYVMGDKTINWNPNGFTTNEDEAYDLGSYENARKASTNFNKEFSTVDTAAKPGTVEITIADAGTRNVMEKGDTITCKELTVKAGYHDVTEYGDTLTVTPTEVDNRFIVADGEDLYDNAGSGDKVTMYFGPTGDVASFNFKVSSAQKDLNLAYDLNEIKDVVDAYPDVDFEFINFKSRSHNVLTNAATATFNAIGNKNTTVYEWDGKTLTELNSKYDSVDDTVVVEGIKRLTCYVVSEKELVAETKATEPVTEPIVEPEPDAPATEAPAPSAPSNNDNPSTGAL